MRARKQDAIIIPDMSRKKKRSSTPGSKPNMTARKTIGDILTQIIQRSGVPVAEISERVQVSRQHLYRVQKGADNPTIDLIANIFEACHTSLDEYLRRQSEYGADRQIHNDLQEILDYGHRHAVTVRSVIEFTLNQIAKERQDAS